MIDDSPSRVRVMRDIHPPNGRPIDQGETGVVDATYHTMTIVILDRDGHAFPFWSGEIEPIEQEAPPA